MPIIFKPYGLLDVSTDPAQLPQTGDEFNIESGALTRCKNLRLNQNGVAKTRDGSSKLNAVAMGAPIGHITEQAGDRYSFGTSIYKNETSAGSGYTSRWWSSILYNSYNSTTKNIFAVNGTERVRIENGTLYDWGMDAPEFTFTLLTGLSTGLTGAYNCKFTYARLEDAVVVSESDAGDAADSARTLTNNSLRVRLDPVELVGIDSQITHLRMWRTLANGIVYYFDQTIPIADINSDFAYTAEFEADYTYIAGTGFNIASNEVSAGRYGAFSWEPTYATAADRQNIFFGTSDADYIHIESTTADSSTGTILHTNHDRPPAGTVVIGPNYDGACFMLKDNRVYFALKKQPEYWPPTYYVEAGPVDFPLLSGCFWNGQLYVGSKHEIYLVSGTGPQTYFPYGQNAATGTRGRYGMLPVKGLGIVHVGPDGLYLFNTGSDNKFTGGQFDKIFRGETAGAMPGVGSLETAWLIQYKNLLYFGYPSASNTYPQHVITIDPTTNKATYFDWGIEIPAVCIDRENDRLLGVDTSGYMWHLEDTTKTTDGGTAIAWDLQSKDFTLSTRAHFPRWNKYDVDASSAVSVTGELILDDTVHQQHTITGNRITRRRLVDNGNGERCAIRIHGSGPVSIFAAESE
jgi:hypothetical protein